MDVDGAGESESDGDAQRFERFQIERHRVFRFIWIIWIIGFTRRRERAWCCCGDGFDWVCRAGCGERVVASRLDGAGACA